jgi:hypothetical protein
METDKRIRQKAAGSSPFLGSKDTLSRKAGPRVGIRAQGRSGQGLVALPTISEDPSQVYYGVDSSTLIGCVAFEL